MSRWKIERRGPGCHECDRPFEDGERHACSLTLVPFAETEQGLALAEAQAQAQAQAEAEAEAQAEAAAKAAQAAEEASAAGDDGSPAPKPKKKKRKKAKAQPAPTAPEGPDPETEVLVRRDLCAGCWQGDQAPEREADLFWWFTRHQEKVSRSVSLDLDSLEQLFLQLEGKGERSVRELRYVLCLLLMRKRRIKVERVLRDEEGESFLVKRPRHEERYKVFVYDFDAERMAEIRDELQAIFDGAEAGGVSLDGDGSDDDQNEDQNEDHGGEGADAQEDEAELARAES